MKPNLSVLIVEDNPAKLARVERIIIEQTQDEVSLFIRTACCYDEAVKRLSEEWYDIAILDLLIPLNNTPRENLNNITGQTTEFTITLINRIQSGEFLSCPFLIGLTAYKQEKISNKTLFEDCVLQIETYEEDTTGWADRISHLICVLSKTLDNIGLRHEGRFLTDIVILVAKFDNEFQPINKKIKWLGQPLEKHPAFPNTPIRIGFVNFGTDNTRKVILICCPDMGMVSASSLTTQLLYNFRPQHYVMLGMCCGFKIGADPNKLCDILATKITSCWDEGKYDESYFDTEIGYKYRPKPIMAHKEFFEAFEGFVKTKGHSISTKIGKRKKHRDLRKLPDIGSEVSENPEIKTGNILSGLSVVSDDALVKLILSRAPSALGLEMEIFGVYGAHAYFQQSKSRFLAIKGVADFGTKKTKGTYDPIQKIASEYSYEVFFEFMKYYYEV